MVYVRELVREIRENQRALDSKMDRFSGEVIDKLDRKFGEVYDKIDGVEKNFNHELTCIRAEAARDRLSVTEQVGHLKTAVTVNHVRTGTIGSFFGGLGGFIAELIARLFRP